MRTRVGYAGGTTPNPTYHSLGDHTESIAIDYDPTRISYEQLLELFWRAHDPTERPFSRQYASFVFHHTEEQKRLARKSQERLANRLGRPVRTEIAAAGEFYSAEDYHQKYYLQQMPRLLAEFNAVYPRWREVVDSTAAARVNGYVAGYGTRAELEAEIGSLGLSAEGEALLREIVKCRS